MKIFVVGILVLLVFVSCGSFNRMKANYTGYSEVTIDHVVYLQFPSGVTVKYDTNGKVATVK